MNYPWSGKLHHSRNMPDDWGCIRDDDSRFIFKAMIPDHNEWVLNEHRRNGTDPTQPLVDALLAAVNGREPQQTITPTVPGWYWVRAYDEVAIAKISKLDIQRGVFTFNGNYVFDACKRFDEAKFYGPIPLPEGLVG